MTGIVQQVKGVKRTHCLIHTPTEDFFAHRSDFLDPPAMVEGAEVEFEIKLTWHGWKRAAANVMVLHRKAA